MNIAKFKKFQIITTAIIILLLGFGCNFPQDHSNTTQNNTGTQLDPTKLFQDILTTAQANLQQTTESTETQISVSSDTHGQQTTPEPSVTIDPNRTPPTLPGTFQTDLLNPRDYPHTYIADTCEFLKNRWTPGKAEPGTVVMTIMYHSIVKGDDSAVTLDNQISSERHKQIALDLYNQGFSAIDTSQFVNFMKNNDYIPARSALLITDDRHFESYFTDHFLPLYQDYGWKVVNGWISSDSTTEDLWKENERVEAAGYVDHQAHGVVHNENMSDGSTDEYIYSELQGSIDRIKEHFGKIPQAIIWPGGTFGNRPIQIAKELGYKVGCTVNPRGPVMYNWVPLDDEIDPGRPAYLADGSSDPLFVIPRYWDTDVSSHIDTVRQIGKAAKEQIFANREIELEYYDIVCKSITGEIPGL